MSYPPPGPNGPHHPGAQPPQQFPPGPNGPPHPGAQVPQQFPPGYGPPGGPPPGQYPPGPPPNGGNGFPKVYLVLGAVLVLVLATAAVVLTKVFQSDEDPPASLVTSEAEPSTEEEPTTPAEEPTTEAEPSGAAHALVEDVCEVIEPEVSTYITVDDEETEAGINEFFGGSECYMTAVLEAGEFSTASFYVTQKADQEDLEAAAGDYEFDLGLISASCTVTEDVEGPWEQAVYFFGSQEDGCAFLGYTHTLLVLDGNMFIQAEIVYGDEESDGAAELAVLTGLAEAITEASIP